MKLCRIKEDEQSVSKVNLMANCKNSKSILLKNLKKKSDIY